MYDIGASMRKDAQQEKSFDKSREKSNQNDQQNSKEEANLDENEHVNISNQLQPNENIYGNNVPKIALKKSISKRLLKKTDPSRIHSRRITTSNFTHLTSLFSSKSQIRHYYQSRQKQLSNKTNNEKNEKEENQCLVCVNNPSDAVFMPCGHGGICYECSLDLWKRTGECYLCRNEINCVMQIDVQNTFGEYLKIISETYLEAQGVNEAEGDAEIDILQNDDFNDINDSEKFDQEQL